MVEKKLQYIKSIIIKRLCDKVNIKLQFEPKVNILVGKNGTGKSRILNLIESITKKPNIIDNNVYIDNNIKIEFSSNNDLSNSINIKKISTLDMSIDEFESRLILYKQKYLKTQLDLVLVDLINEFKSYQLTLRKLIESKIMAIDNEIKALSSQESVTQEELLKLRNLLKQKDDITTNINHIKNLFLDLINQLFSDTNKRIDFDENNSIVFQQKGNQIISSYQLSSGEKRLLIILLTIVIQQNKPCIFLIDEPEVSLHLSWQHKLIDVIQLLHNNCQLIIVTQSPDIFSKGWQNKVINIE